ncbi:MAG: TolC family protein [Deltaproteobacteria bacterium]|nr:TolC family protein [Deltaproteobacteria bacterium]
MQAFSRVLAACLPLLSAVVGRGWLVVLSALASVALAMPAQAEEAAPTALSAQEFLARAGRSHPSLPLLEAAIEEAAANVTAAGLWANPSLSYDREEVFAGGRGQPENFVRLALPLEISGRRGLNAEGAELGLEAARATSARERSGLLFDALRIYWSAAQARQGLGVLRQEREALGKLVEAVRSRTFAGDASGYDLDRLELEVETLEDLVADAEREVEGWQRRIALLVGAPGERFDASDPLVLPGQPQSSVGLVQQALAARADYRAARLRVAQAERELSAGRRGWVPTLVLSGGAKSAAVSESESAWGYVAGLALGVPLFDHGQGEVARAHARLRQAEGEQRLIEAQVTTEVMTAYGALARFRAQAERFERTQVPRLESLERRAQISYQEGERPVFELLDAYRTARGVRLRLVELRQKARLAEIDLTRATGQSPGGAP